MLSINIISYRNNLLHYSNQRLLQMIILKKNEWIDQGSSNSPLLSLVLNIIYLFSQKQQQQQKLAVPTTRTGHQVHVCTCHINV